MFSPFAGRGQGVPQQKPTNLVTDETRRAG
jgi:hypothetical protein